MAVADGEIEMPTMDFSAGSDEFSADFDDQVAPPADPFADTGGMSDVEAFADTSAFAEPEPAFDDVGGGGFEDGTIEG